MNKKPNLRKCVNEKCRSCIFDPQAAGTWRQQVTLCSVKNCALYPVRPVTKAPIPESVLDYYSVTGAERVIYRRSRPPEGPVSERNQSDKCPSEGCLDTTVVDGPIRGDKR